MHMHSSFLALSLSLFLFFCIGYSQILPGARFSLTKDFLNNFIRTQLPIAFNNSIFIPEISRNTSHQRFVLNITDISIKNLDLSYMKSEINFDVENKKIIIDLVNLNIDLYFEYYIRALLLKVGGNILFKQNVTFHFEISSKFDENTQQPKFEMTNIKVEYFNLQLLFGGSILSTFLNILEGFADVVTKDQYPFLLQSVFDKLSTLVINELSSKHLIDLNFAQIGIDLQSYKEVEITKEVINFFSAALFYDPFDPYNLPQPASSLSNDFPKSGVQLTLNQEVFNSLLWVLNKQKILNITLFGDNLPVKLPFQIDTKLFELIFPSFYNFYGENRIIDLNFNSLTAPRIQFQKENNSIHVQLNESVTFLVRLENYTDHAFTVDFTLDAIVNLTVDLNQTIWGNLLDLSLSNISLAQNKIPGLEIDKFISQIQSLMGLAKNYINLYLKNDGFSLPEINDVVFKDFGININDENLSILTNLELLNLNNLDLLMKIKENLEKWNIKIRKIN